MSGVTIRGRDDLADAAVVASVAAALRSWREATHRDPSSKVLREAIWFFWQGPRLPRPLVASKYPRSAPWSEDAARLVIREEPLKDRLVIEHTEPLNRTFRWLLDELPDARTIVTELPRRIACVVVTTEQGKLLPDAGTPEERYATVGLDLRSFRSLDEWVSAERRPPPGAAENDASAEHTGVPDGGIPR